MVDLTNKTIEKVDLLYKKASDYIDSARQSIQRSVDSEIVKAYWLIGRDIVEEEQLGKERAGYGRSLLKSLSEKLTSKYRRGFSIDTLERARKFYLTYKDRIEQNSATLLRNSENLSNNAEILTFSQNLSWAHYILLMRIKTKEARDFYEIETLKNHWSSRELKRQIGSLLFDRVAKSKNKAEIIRLACKGQELFTPVDAIKDPMILEFLDLPEAATLEESKFEDALIQNMQHFLLELGKGFAFVARQKRLTLEGDHFYADLVMYNIHLKCYVIIDLKTKALTHADLGQIQLYVNYFDQEIKMDNDNPSIGLVLCTTKNDSMVKYLLGNNSKKIFASTYQLHLPSEEELRKELNREVKEIEYHEDMQDKSD